MTGKNRYGRVLTEDEYSERLAGLIRQFGQSAPDAEGQDKMAEDEFNLLIDFKLGIDFPKDKRDALGKARQLIREHHQLLVSKFQAGEISAEELGAEIEQKIPAMMAEEFSKILSADDLEKLLGTVEDRVPIDDSKIGRESSHRDPDIGDE